MRPRAFQLVGLKKKKKERSRTKYNKTYWWKSPWNEKK